MTHPRERLALVVAVMLAAGCTPTSATTTPASTPPTTPTPTATATPTYGPNQTAAIAAVTGYFTWWNAARKNPMEPNFKVLEKYVAIDATISATSMGDIASLASHGRRQVGDMFLVSAVPTTVENGSEIAITACVDRTRTSLVDASGATIDPTERGTGKTIPASQVFIRQTYVIVTKPKAGVWAITDLTAATYSC